MTATIIAVCVSTAAGIGVGIMGWSMRRIVSTNDREHEATNARIEKLIGAIEAEREARHRFVGQLTDRVWAVNSDLKENYVTRREALRQFGTLCQKIDGHHKELSVKIDALPCRTPACPPGATV